MRSVLLAVFLLPALAAAQPADSLVALPRYHRTVQGNFRPPQTSAARAFLYSTAATGVPVLLGTAVALSGPLTRSDDALSARGIVATVLVVTGVMVGPAVGTMSLGAGETVGRGARIIVVGMEVGGGLVVAGAGVLVLSLGSGSGGGAGTLALGMVAGGAGVFFGGFVAAGIYNFATIPANARWAQRARANGNRVPAREVRVSVAPGYDPRFDAPMATVRIAM